MTRFQVKAVVDAINRMFKSNYFDICTVDKCMKIIGSAKTADYDAMHTYHCVNYSAMDRETKDWLFQATIENICNVNNFPEIKLVDPNEEMENLLTINQDNKSIIKRLFG